MIGNMISYLCLLSNCFLMFVFSVKRMHGIIFYHLNTFCFYIPDILVFRTSAILEGTSLWSTILHHSNFRKFTNTEDDTG